MNWWISLGGRVSRRGWVLFAAMSVIWGMPYLLIKIAVGGVSAPVLVLARVAIGAALLAPFALRRGQLAAIKPVWRWLVLFAFVEVIVPWLVLSEAERSISSSLTGLLIASVPIMVAVIGLLSGSSDRLSPVRWTGLLIGLVGVALLAGPNRVGCDRRRGQVGRRGPVRCALLRGRPADHQPQAPRRLVGSRDPGLPRAGGRRLRPARRAELARARPVGQGPAVDRGTGRDLHGGGVPALLRASLRGRTGPGERDHLHQPGDRGLARRDRARRE